jgi:xanthine/uracil permease
MKTESVIKREEFKEEFYGWIFISSMFFIAATIAFLLAWILDIAPMYITGFIILSMGLGCLPYLDKIKRDYGY